LILHDDGVARLGQRPVARWARRFAAGSPEDRQFGDLAAYRQEINQLIT
jgi:hypothetical protein